MSLETEVISCPACSHLLRVPLDWLGQPVQCPECKAMFKAPVPDGDTLTKPELISRPPRSTGQAPPRKKLDAMLLLPAFGLLFCGVAGIIINGMLAYLFLADPAGGKQYIRNQMPEFRKAGLGANDPPEVREQRDEERAEIMARTTALGHAPTRGRERNGIPRRIVDRASLEPQARTGWVRGGGIERDRVVLHPRRSRRALGSAHA